MNTMIKADGAATPALPASVGDFADLLKMRVMSLVVFTALVGMVLSGGALHPVLAAIALLAIAIGAGAAGAINMWYESDIDALMLRTRGRPIPSGRVEPDAAIGFGMFLAVGSVLILALASNWLAAALLSFTIFFYGIVYTMILKRRTAQNIVIGGAAGALPPVIGWAAMTGSLSLEPLILFAIIFLWTPPHFWALALLKSDEYTRAGVPMMPAAAGEASTRRQILIYTVVTALTAVAPWVLGYSGAAYGLCAVVLGALFVRAAWRAAATADRGPDAVRRSHGALFGFSIVYLFGIFAALAIDHAITWSLG